jgi:EmrB/QacA subfamily drug resistance transporter
MTSSTTEIAPPTLMSDRRLNLVSFVLIFGAIASILDTTIVNVALDHLHTVFHASVADTQWVATGYLLALAGVIPLTGWASERFGARTMWISAVALFLFGSILCGFAWSLPSLIAFRVLQGVGGGMILPITMAILTQSAGPSRIQKAMAAIAIPGQLAPIFGPVIGGAIVDSINWNWLFFVNIPICAVALILAPIFLPGARPDHSKKLDVRGFALLTPGLVALAYGISQAAGKGGFGAFHTWFPIAGGVVLIILFVVYSLRTKVVPLVDVRPFARRSFGVAGVITFVGGFSTYASMFLLPLFYQVVRGESVLNTGLLLIPQGVGTVLFLLLMKPISRWLSPRALVIGGTILGMVSMIPFALATANGSDVLLLAAQFVRGFGFGASLIPLSTVAFASLSRAEIPRASAAFSVVQRVGAPFGVTVVAVILQGYLANATGTAAGIAGAFGTTFWWILAFSIVPLVIAFFVPNLGKVAAPVAEPVVVD